MESIKDNNITIEDIKGTSSKKVENYRINSIEYTGRKAIGNSNNDLEPFGERQKDATTTANGYELLTTGASESTKMYNIYDMGGNEWEWTDEVSFYGGNTSTQYKELPGGGYSSSSQFSGAGIRHGKWPYDTTNTAYYFRVVLYIK